MRVLFDLTLRTKASSRIRQGLLPHMARLSAEHGWTITALLPSAEARSGQAPVRLVAAPGGTDAYLDEVWLPRAARHHDVIVTPREGLRLGKRRPRVVLQLHEHQHARYGRADSARAALRSAHQHYRASQMYRDADHICFSSTWTADQFSLLEGAPPASASVVPLSGWADDVARDAGLSPKQQAVLVMGSTDPRDDLGWGFAVWEAAQLPEPWSLVVVGDVRQVHKERVRYTGRIGDEELQDEMRKASAYVHVGRVEGFGLAVVEALQLGAYTVARPGSAVDEVLQAGGGALAADTQTAAEHLRAMTLGTTGSQCAEQARTAGLSFSWARTADGLAAGVRAVTATAT